MFRRSRLLGYTVVCALAVFTLLRLVLLAQNWALVPHTFLDLVKTLVGALRFDVAVVGILILPGALWVALRKERIGWAAAGPVSALLFLFWFIFLYLNVADGFFFAEFNAHFNYVAVDYIFVNGREVVENIWQSYPVIPVTLGIAVGAALLTTLILRWSKTRVISSRVPVRRPGLFLLWMIVTGAALASVPLRGSPVNANRILGELSTNGFFTLGYALATNDMAYGDYYESLSAPEALKRVREKIVQPGQNFLSEEKGLLRQVPGSESPRRMNVVIILEESFGSEFVDTLYPHPQPVTPEFSKLIEQGLFFKHIYATGNRTVRGLEGVLASFPPIPGASIVKRKPERAVPTLATVLKNQGYQTSFIYGGRGAFDSLRSFTTQNGFDTFIEQKDFDAPVFTTAWGVSDEDIFKKANLMFESLPSGTTPFFSVILTVSNHRPYLYPKGRIDLDPEAKKRENVVKYADWAIGQFFKDAQEKAYFKNTLFVLLGDHGARVYGADSIPLASYEIPLWFYAPDLLQPRQVETVGGSMDVAPTILGLLGLPYESPFFGRDLLRVEEEDGYALMQHDRELGLFDGESMAVLTTPKNSAVFRLDPEKKTFRPDTASPENNRDLIQDAIAFYQTGYLIFEQALKRAHP